MDMSNNVVFRQVVDQVYIPGSTVITNYASTNMLYPPWSEYYIGLLDQPVPDSIGFVPVIPTNWLAWFDAVFLNTPNTPGVQEYSVPLYVRNCQHRTPEMRDLTYLYCTPYHYFGFNVQTLTNWTGHDFEEGGDSGSPYFFVFDGELCLANIRACNIWFIGGNSLFDPGYQQASINAAMRELSLRNGRTNVYSLTVKDLSKYPTCGRTFNCPP
jgi:hypothetical protein